MYCSCSTKFQYNENGTSNAKTVASELLSVSSYLPYDWVPTSVLEVYIQIASRLDTFAQDLIRTAPVYPAAAVLLSI
ncbi:hypothetical protein LCGC14_2976090, partial [marine sediment metagenome]